MKISSQRTTIIKKFLESEDHCTTEDLNLTLKRKSECIGCVTVHRILKLLVDSGIAEELYFRGGYTCFEAIRSIQHHDLIIWLVCIAVG